jgi:thioredoxin 2
MHLVCPACGTVNRVAEEHLDREPTCGHCKVALMAPQPVALDDTRVREVRRTHRAAGAH